MFSVFFSLFLLIISLKFLQSVTISFSVSKKKKSFLFRCDLLTLDNMTIFKFWYFWYLYYLWPWVMLHYVFPFACWNVNWEIGWVKLIKPFGGMYMLWKDQVSFWAYYPWRVTLFAYTTSQFIVQDLNIFFIKKRVKRKRNFVQPHLKVHWISGYERLYRTLKDDRRPSLICLSLSSQPYYKESIVNPFEP